MRKSFVLVCGMILVFLMPFATPARLTDATFFSTDAAGVATVVSWWDTLGVGETVQVPEPTTWVLCLLALGFGLRYRGR